MNQPQYCPYLGTKFDRNTKWGYASHLATCYLSEKEPFAPSLSHQQRFCLTERYPQCFRLTGQPTVVAPMYEGAAADPARTTPRGRTAADPSQAGLFPPADQGFVQPGRANPDTGTIQISSRGPYSSATPTPRGAGPVPPAARPALGRYSGQPDVGRNRVRPNAAAMLEGLADAARSLGRLGLAAVGAVVLLLLAAIFLWQVLAGGTGSSQAAGKATPAARSGTPGASVPVLPTPGPGLEPTQPAGAANPAVKPTPPPVRRGEVFNTDGAGLNLRAEPSTTGAVLARIPEGGRVEILGSRETVDGTWLQVRYNNLTGWVAGRFIR